MNVWLEMMTALRGGINELGETMKASQAIEILDMKIRQTEQALQEYKTSLGSTIVKQKQAELQVEELSKQIAKYEVYALKSLEKKDEALALEVSEEIAILENELLKQKIIVKSSISIIEQLRATISNNEQEIIRLTQQRDTIRASTQVNTAQQNNVTKVGEVTKVKTARDILAKLKTQQNQQQKIKESGSLKSRLLEAGIIDEDEEADANAVLKNLKKTKKVKSKN